MTRMALASYFVLMYTTNGAAKFNTITMFELVAEPSHLKKEDQWSGTKTKGNPCARWPLNLR